MKCNEIDALLCDYVDDTLLASDRAAVETHLAGCPACAELVRDIRAAVGFMAISAAVEPPPALINRILFEARAGEESPLRKQGVRHWFSRIFEPVLQPKFAMGMAMTILSFSMLGRFAGIQARPLKPSDLEPAKIYAALEDKAVRSWERAKKYYESLRVVYEIQQTLNDWSQTDDQQQAAPGAKPGASSNKSDLEGPIQPAPKGENKSNDRVNGRPRQ